MKRRKDNKGRILRNGESQRKDGSYCFKYFFNGKQKFLYSWKLVKTDKLPKGKRQCKSLREQEKEINNYLEKGIDLDCFDTTVGDMLNKYITLKPYKRESTKKADQDKLKFLLSQDFSKRKITKVKISDAKAFLKHLQDDLGYAFNTICCFKSMLKASFQIAVEDDIILKNPFLFTLSNVVNDDYEKKKALTIDEETSLLNFIKESEYYSCYYDAILILFKTGIRISEFCGLTFKDIDFKNKILHINHQLLHRKGIYYIEKAKSEAGVRDIPMTNEVYRAFKSLISNRNNPKIEPIVDGYFGFLYVTRNGTPSCNTNWGAISRRICKAYNKQNSKNQIYFTPHICRHTFCTNMANAGMKPKSLQYLMGHSNVSTTFDVYTDNSFNQVAEEVYAIEKQV